MYTFAINRRLNIRKLEAELWESADLLRASLKLTSNQYCMSVLDLIFLRYAYSRFRMLEKNLMFVQNDRILKIYNTCEFYQRKIECSKSQPAITVAEMLPPDLSYKVIEYNHHSMKGDLERKRVTLKLLADQLESKKEELKGINKQLKDDIFYMFNNLSIRHNNAEKIKGVSESKLEEWYDYAYELSLLAFMTLEKSNHKQFVLDIKKEIGDV